jgi:probable addiction module antidote protein
MPKTVTTPWDPADHLKTEEDMVAYLEAALEEADPALVAAALGDIARAKGMTQVARDAGLGRESLYKALSPAGNPEFATILKVVSALGLQLHAAPAAVRSAV